MTSEDEAAIRRLAALYAQAVDRGQPELLLSLFTADAVIEGPGFRMQGHDQIRAIPGMLRLSYSLTLHLVMNQVFEIAGEVAEGETCGLANHLSGSGAAASNLVWALRYQDRLRRENGKWRFERRRIVIDWTETRPVQIPPG
jgi:uncharacterized protein (TIGR02246 family)